MLQNISKNITYYFLKKDIITKSDIEKCEYSLHKRLMYLVFLSVMSLFALLSGEFIETMVFLIIVLSLRKRSGGFHLEKELSCLILSVLVSILGVNYIAPTIEFLAIFKLVIYVMSVLVLLIYAPVNHPNLNMSINEIKLHKDKMKNQIYIYSALVLLMEVLNINNSIQSLLISGVMLVALSVLISKIIKQEV